MVEDQHRVAARNAIDAGDGERNPGGRESGAGDGAHRPPAPVEAGQRHHGEPRQHIAHYHHDPPPGGIERRAENRAEPADLRMIPASDRRRICRHTARRGAPMRPLS